MAPLETEFPAIRACIFDMDGLLLNTEDIITGTTNSLLQKYNRPPMPDSLRAQLMGITNSTNSDTFHNFAKLPISAPNSPKNQETKCISISPTVDPSLAQRNSFQHSAVRAMLTTRSYELKTSGAEAGDLLRVFGERRVLGDDVRLGGRGKPMPDIYLVALGVINDEVVRAGGERILPQECLVFEDSVAGVEAGRRAGMRVVWVPHSVVMGEYGGRVGDVLAGRSGVFGIGNEGLLGVVGDGWAECIGSLEDFAYGKYGIEG
ncbi:HAD-like domain-containing protein [Penicillium bovifimosum]|uniref:HAD-like domain-containing protein n=1 Tax=Penicillium bovifimosum TaxID=126998 RepID=A0A9W9L035_9EURO|nr:HAD-like domain-containing protein [Penicillium bovifimosum]KAJ5129350.1 HAD-like domain-containing protein [Penicillium bovifimosum]